ncbi:MAG TPA: PKD domain-containing protein, partial [Candidatus Sulfotelmatobacter sp.]|nr:PKD domain-containing protein [Candidatus Sulfotelmatobacter sp.]
MILKGQTTRIAILLLTSMLFSVILAPANSPGNIAGSGVHQFPIGTGSWNPKVPCSSPWIVRVTDITDNLTGSSSLSNSIFNPGITSPVGDAKRWLTPGSTPPGWVSPGPSCTITNSHGTVAMFVEIDGVKRDSLVNEDCASSYDAVNGGGSNGGSYCDSTFNFYDPTVVPNYSASCTSSSDPTCYGIIHSEIDHDWKAAHYCGTSTTCDDAALSSQTTTSTLVDFQGFIYWDPGHLTEQWHSFSGWEIHPLTAWRLHQSNPSLTANFNLTPSSPTVGQTVTFTATASGGTTPYTFSWSFGDGTTGTGNPTTHSYSTTGTFNAQLTVGDST